MIKNYVLQRCNAPGTNSSVTLGTAQQDRLTWAQAYADGALVFYFLDDGAKAEWGVGTFRAGNPATVSRDLVVGNTAVGSNNPQKLNFTGAVDCYNEIPGERMPFINGGIIQAPGARLDTHAGGVPIGASMDYYGTALPAGWLWTNGGSISRTTFAQLFAVIGVTYGSVDAASFSLPNRCEVLSVGRGNMNGAPPRGILSGAGPGSGFVGYSTLGAVIGSAGLHQHTHVLTVTDGPGNLGHGHVVVDNGHLHTIFDPGHQHAYTFVDFPAGAQLAAGTGVNIRDTSVGTTAAFTGITRTDGEITGIAVASHRADITVSMASAGAGNAENIPPVLVCNNIIYAGSSP